MKPSDLTLLEGIVVVLNAICATSYLVLTYNIFSMKKYLKWNRHIYPTMMYGSFILSGSLFWLLSTYYFLNIENVFGYILICAFVGMMAIGYAVAAEAKRIAHKYDKIQTLEKEISHLQSALEVLKKNKVLALLIGAFLLVNCGGLKKEITKLKQENINQTELYTRQITDLTEKIKETEQKQTTTQTELEQKEKEITSLKKQRDELKETLDKMEKTDVSVTNPKGKVKVTDAKGNSYEFEGGEGTIISNKTESTLKSTLDKVSENLSELTVKA